MKKTARIVSATALLSLGVFVPAGTTPALAHHDESGATPTSLTPEQKALQQTLSASEPLGQGHVEISHGHVDMGPKFVDGKWQLMFHDDHAEQPVWRRPSDVVLKGGDAALLPKPDDARYSFVNVPAGEKVYVVPQTERSGVVWPGWTTQDPEVVSQLGRGVTLTLDKVEGPGQFILYLENGNFSAPQVLWNSDSKEPQDIWVDPNTHTHANWVFTKPGTYFLTVTAKGELANGTTVTDTERLQYAIGDATTAEQVFAQAAQSPAVSASDQGSAQTSAQATSHASAVASPANSAQQTTSEPQASGQPASDQKPSSLPLVAGGIVLLALVAGGLFVGLKKRGSSAEQTAKDLLK